MTTQVLEFLILELRARCGHQRSSRIIGVVHKERDTWKFRVVWILHSWFLVIWLYQRKPYYLIVTMQLRVTRGSYSRGYFICTWSDQRGFDPVSDRGRLWTAAIWYVFNIVYLIWTIIVSYVRMSCIKLKWTCLPSLFQLLGTAEDSTKDVDGLHSKLSRKCDVEMKNAVVQSEFEKRFLSSIRAMDANLHAFEVQQRTTNSDICVHLGKCT